MDVERMSCRDIRAPFQDKLRRVRSPERNAGRNKGAARQAPAPAFRRIIPLCIVLPSFCYDMRDSELDQRLDLLVIFHALHRCVHLLERVPIRDHALEGKFI